MYLECFIEWQKWLIHLYYVIKDWKYKPVYVKNCKQFFKEALFWYNLNPKGIFLYDDKQFMLLTSMGNNNP